VVTDPATTTIIGPGASLLANSGGGKSHVRHIEGGSLALDGLTITGGRVDRGGGILNDGTLWLDHVIIRGNRDLFGGALFNNGTAALTDVVMRGNTTRAGPGVFNTRRATLAWLRSPAGGADRLGFPSNYTRPIPAASWRSRSIVAPKLCS
jgi:hypothetical protein